jgi:hypothetical protein
MRTGRDAFPAQDTAFIPQAHPVFSVHIEDLLGADADASAAIHAFFFIAGDAMFENPDSNSFRLHELAYPGCIGIRDVNENLSGRRIDVRPLDADKHSGLLYCLSNDGFSVLFLGEGE